MSTASERIYGGFRPDHNRSITARQEQLNQSREVLRTPQLDRLFSPEYFLAQQALGNRDPFSVPFISELVENLDTPVKGVARIVTPVAVSLVLACAPDAKAVSPISTPEPPRATAEAQKSPTPVEVKTLQCDILSPEACATGEYIEWNRPDGEKLRGIGFILKPGELVKLPKEGLAVSTRIIEQPYVYRGIGVTAMAKDGSETYVYYANLDPTRLKLVDLPPNTVGIIADSNLTVFESQPYNLVFASFPGMEKFTPITKGTPKAINNKVPGNPASNTAFFYDVAPPK